MWSKELIEKCIQERARIYFDGDVMEAQIQFFEAFPDAYEDFCEQTTAKIGARVKRKSL